MIELKRKSNNEVIFKDDPEIHGKTSFEYPKDISAEGNFTAGQEVILTIVVDDHHFNNVEKSVLFTIGG